MAFPSQIAQSLKKAIAVDTSTYNFVLWDTRVFYYGLWFEIHVNAYRSKPRTASTLAVGAPRLRTQGTHEETVSDVLTILVVVRNQRPLLLLSRTSIRSVSRAIVTHPVPLTSTTESTNAPAMQVGSKLRDSGNTLSRRRQWQRLQVMRQRRRMLVYRAIMHGRSGTD